MTKSTTHNLLIFLLGTVWITFTPLETQAQKSNTVKVINDKEVDFRRALHRYRSRNYLKAFTDFESLSNSSILHHRITASLLMTGRSLYHLEKFSDATRYSDKLIDTFSQSKYVDDAYFLKASSYYQLNDNFNAARYFLWISDWSSDARLVAKSQNIANSIIRSKLSLSELNKLLQFANGETSAAVVTIGLAKKEIKIGSAQRAGSLLKNYKKKFGPGGYSDQMDDLLHEAENPGSQSIKIGVVLPLTGFFSEEGQGVFRGIKFAYLQLKNSSGQPIQLVVRDSQGNMIKAIHATKNLIRQENVQAIIGELESSITAGIGALASNENIPLLGPAATENQVASVGSSVYQLNSDLERKGQALALYAYDQLGFRTFATLAPADEYGQQMTDSFTSTIDRLGGRIVAQSWYYDTPEDLSRQFKSIREAAFSYDSTDVEQMIIEADEQGRDLEEKDIPVLSIDAIFLPIYSDDIKYIGPQFALSNIRTQIVGGEYWDDLDILKVAQIQPYVDGAIFVSDYFPDEDNRVFRRFRSDFRIRLKKTPERWEIFGYDAFNLLSGAISKGAKTGHEINRRLNTISGYRGMKGDVSFKGNQRVNREVHFLQFVNGRIIKHQVELN